MGVRQHYSREQVEQLNEVLQEVRERLGVLQTDTEANTGSINRLRQVEQEIVSKLDQYSPQRGRPVTKLFEHTVLYRATAG